MLSRITKADFEEKSSKNALYYKNSNKKADKKEIDMFGLITTYKPLLIEEVYTDRRFYGQVIKVAQNSDLCMIFVEIDDMHPAKIGHKEPENGDLLYNYSNPLGVKGVWKEGIFTGWVWVWMFAERIGTLDIYPGSSGSGIFNIKGELVGLINGMSVGFDLSTFSFIKSSLSVPLAQILLFIQR